MYNSAFPRLTHSPQLIKQFGFSPINSQGLTVAPYVVGWFFVVGQAFHSDRTRDRGWHVAFSATVAFIGYLILALCAQASTGASYFAMFLVIGGLFSMFPLVMYVLDQLRLEVMLTIQQELGGCELLPDIYAWRRNGLCCLHL